MPQEEFVPYSPNSTLTSQQHHVLALLAEGRSIAEAAAESGVHRNTVRNWRRAVPAFAREVEFAVREQALAWREEAVRMAPRAAQVLEETLTAAETSPALRLRAALAILKTAADPQPRPMRPFPTAAAEMEAEEGKLLAMQAAIAEAAENTMHNEIEFAAQLRTTPPVVTVRKPPTPGRNSTCPCGSGLKYKRCCANKPAQPQAATAG